jgi:hypothetical protein
VKRLSPYFPERALFRPIPVSVALVALCSLTLDYRMPFRVSDDSGMMLWLQGMGFPELASDFVMFIHVWLARVIRLLYRVLPALPAYGAVLLGLHAIALGILAWSLMRDRPGGKRVLVVSLYLVSCHFLFVFRPTFTLTAFTLTQTAWYLLLSGDFAKDVRSPGLIVGALLLSAAGAMVRQEAWLLACVLIAPAYLTAAISLGRNAKAIAASAAVAAALVGVGLGLKAIDDAYYQSAPGWETFREFNSVRGALVDYGLVALNAESRPILLEQGWSENDFKMLTSFWLFPDPKVYSKARMESLIEAAAPVVAPGRRITRLFSFWNSQAFRDWQSHLALLALVGLFLVATKRARAATLLTALVSLAVALYLHVEMKFPDRLYLPMLAFVAGSALLFSPRRAGDTFWELPLRLPSQTEAARAFLVFLLANAAIVLIQRERSYRKVALAANRQIIRQLRALPKENTYVSLGGALSLKSLGALQPTSELRRLRLLPMGTSQQSPLVRDRLAALGIDDFFAGILNRPDILLLGGSSQPLGRYYKEHYGIEIALEATEVPGARRVVTTERDVRQPHERIL